MEGCQLEVEKAERAVCTRFCASPLGEVLPPGGIQHRLQTFLVFISKGAGGVLWVEVRDAALILENAGGSPCGEGWSGPKCQ